MLSSEVQHSSMLRESGPHSQKKRWMPLCELVAFCSSPMPYEHLPDTPSRVHAQFSVDRRLALFESAIRHFPTRSIQNWQRSRRLIPCCSFDSLDLKVVSCLIQSLYQRPSEEAKNPTLAVIAERLPGMFLSNARRETPEEEAA